MSHRSFFSLLGVCALFLIACQKEPQPIKVTGITLNSTSMSLTEGETADLIATVSPKDADNQTVLWSSSNGSVASVSKNGRIDALAPGSSTITAKSDDGGFTASCSVTVVPKIIKVSSVSLSKTELKLTEGDSETLTATVKPDDATDKTIIWSSSDTEIVSVDENGKVTAIKEGTAIIIAIAGDKQAYCSVTVAKRVIEVESVTLNKTELFLEKGDSETLLATVNPDDATNKTVTWSSSDDGIVSVNQEGKITAIKGGEATITASASGKSATCVVTVLIPVESVSLDRTSITIEEGQSLTLIATVKPDDATDKSISWSSSSETVAKVDQNGKVTAVQEGSATITAKAGDKEAICKVSVQKKVIAVESVTLDKTTATLEEGQSLTLVATVKPGNATNKTVSWSSSNVGVASVDQNGIVRAIKEGTATITAKSGEKQATCLVVVNPKVVHVEGVVLNKTNVEIIVGGSFELIATVYPESATNKGIVWTSSNDNVATVDAGIVKGVNPGEVIIKATTIDGGFYDTCKVKITAPVSKSLTFTSSGVTSVGLVKVGSPNAITLEYSKNGFEWHSYTVGDYISLSDGERLMFRAGAEKNYKFSSSISDYYKFESNGSGTISASGSVMTLLDRDCSVPLSSYCFCGLFDQCFALTSAPEFPANVLARDCYMWAFRECQSLTSAPDLPATKLVVGCYYEMFKGCQSLRTAPALPATTLAEQCYFGMFSDCVGLKSAPKLPAMSLAKNCYDSMFYGCTSLSSAPNLPATSLAEYCYSRMFWGCTSLVVAPNLPATSLAAYCYNYMFSECSALTTAPNLPATTLADSCYLGMFYNCSNLTTAPSILATTLAESCCFGMFAKCSNLTSAPSLLAKYLVSGCYTEMFYRCTKLSYVKALFKTTPGDGYTRNWLVGVKSSGTFVKASDASWDVSGTSGIPSGWTVVIE